MQDRRAGRGRRGGGGTALHPVYFIYSAAFLTSFLRKQVLSNQFLTKHRGELRVILAEKIDRFLCNWQCGSSARWNRPAGSRSVSPSFSTIFNRKMQKLPLFSCMLIRNEGKNRSALRHSQILHRCGFRAHLLWARVLLLLTLVLLLVHFAGTFELSLLNNEV